MIRKLSGTSPRNFAMQELFGPLGIQNIHWEGYSEIGRGHGMTQWPNPYNDEPLGYGLWLKPRDMIKFGELYLNGGLYNGRRIIDQSWIDASWTTYSNPDNGEFLKGNAVERIEWGTGQFSVVDCNRLDFKIESEEIATVVPLKRLTGNCASHR